MNQELIPVQVYGVLPTQQQTVAIFIGNSEKVFIVNVDMTVGRAIAMCLSGEKNDRPLTHELIGLIFSAFDIAVERVIINELRSNTYYARLILRAQNEVHKKIIEIDARPSDCLTIALQSKCPIFVARDVWDETDDMSDLLQKMKEAQRKAEEGEQPPDEPDFGIEPDK